MTRKNAKHSEVLSGATFHAANNERGAKTQARVYEGSGHRVKVAQRGKKWGCWVWPKHAKNPPMRLTAKDWRKFGKTTGEQERASAKVGLSTASMNDRFKFIWDRALSNGETLASGRFAAARAFGAGYHAAYKKRNPASGAVAMHEAFTGLPSKKDVVVSESVHVHSHLAALGELIELKVKTVKGETVVIDFAKAMNPKKDVLSKIGKKTKGWIDRRGKALTGTVKYLTDYWINPRKMNPNGPVLLCSNESGTHLFIEGGDQSLDLGKLGLSELKGKESVIIGAAKVVTYHARKKFDGKEEEYDYVHKFSEDSDGPLPMLRYDVRNKHLYLDSGVYHIPKPLFGNSASQGITD